MRDQRSDEGCTCVVGDAVEYHGHRALCPARSDEMPEPHDFERVAPYVFGQKEAHDGD